MNKIAVRWTDQNNRKQSREYDNVHEAKKAHKWLLENGAEDADIAVIVRVEKKQEEDV